MSKDCLDYTGLFNKLTQKTYKLADVQNRLEKVAFDIVRFKDGDKAAQLWQVQPADDGEYIVALYQEDEEKKTACPWDVAVSKVGSNVQISYKGDPLVNLSSNKLGIPSKELSHIEAYLPAKLQNNPKLVQALLKELDETTKKAVLKKYPELA